MTVQSLKISDSNLSDANSFFCPLCLEPHARKEENVTWVMPVKILTSYNKEENSLLHTVEKVCSPVTHIFCEKSLKEAIHHNNDIPTCSICRRPFDNLVKIEGDGESIDTIKVIFNTFKSSLKKIKPSTLKQSIDQLIEKKEFGNVIHIISKNFKVFLKSNINDSISKIIDKVSLEEFLEMINSIQEQAILCFLATRATNLYLNKKEHKNALETAKFISNKTDKSLALQKIAILYLHDKKQEKAFEITSLIPHQSTKDCVLKEISKNYLKAEKIEEALAIAKTISKIKNKSRILKTIVEAYLNNQEKEKALEIAQLIPKESQKNYALRDIAEIYFKNHEEPNFLKTTELMSKKYLQNFNLSLDINNL